MQYLTANKKPHNTGVLHSATYYSKMPPPYRARSAVASAAGSDQQSEKAHPPILVTVCGIATEASAEQLLLLLLPRCRVGSRDASPPSVVRRDS